MSQVRFDVLGPLRIRRDDKLLPVTGLKNRTVIACLALNPEQLIDVQALLKAAWDAPAPRSAVHQIRKIISGLRSNLDDGWDTIATFREGYLLKVPPESSDVTQFSRLYNRAMSGPLDSDEDLSCAYTALALWRGRPCEGSEPRGSGGRIDELVAQHRALLDRAVARFSQRGREDELVAILQIASRIHGEEMRHDCRELGEKTTTGAPRRPVPVLGRSVSSVDVRVGQGRRCLPRDLGDFSGRSAEVRRLLDMVGREDVGLSVATVHGMGGIGKTALAVHVAHRLAPEFPDGQFFVNLNASSSAVTCTVRDAVGSLLSQAGLCDDDVPSSEEGRLALWRDFAAGRRLLIVIDDAASAAQVEPLIPTSQGACIVTSRVVLNAIDAAHYTRLEVPPDDQCVEMLRSMLGAALVDDEPDASLSLARRVGNLPLALRLAAARLQTREHVTIADLLRSLDESTSAVDDLDVPGRSVLGRLDTSLKSMDRDDLDLFLRLCLIPSPELDEAAVAAALNLDLDRSRRVCRRFADRALLQRIGSGAYRMHSLLAEAAVTYLPSTVGVDEQRSVLRKAMEHYSQTHGLVGSSRTSPTPGVKPDLVVATIARAADLSRTLDLRASFADLCLAWERPVSLYLDTEQQKQVWRMARDAGREHEDPVVRGRILLASARCSWHRGAVEEGIALAGQAWEEAERADDDLLRVYALLWNSSFSYLCRDLPAGLAYLARARALLADRRVEALSASVRSASAEITSNEAALLSRSGDFETAANLCHAVLGSSDVDPRVTIMATVTLSACLNGRGEHEQGLSVATGALSEADRIRSPYGRALALQQTAAALRGLGRPEEAKAAAAEGRLMACETGSVHLIDELTSFLADGGA